MHSKVICILICTILVLTILMVEIPDKSKAEELEEWVTRYDGPESTNDFAQDIALDPSGNIYVAGFSMGTGTEYDYATIKYDSNGNQKWVARYNGPANDYDICKDIAVDSVGNAYVTGYSMGSADFDYVTIKYDTHGNQQWVARYNGPANDEDWATDIALDLSGNVYVTGHSTSSGTHEDYATIKYDTNGNEQWVARYDGPKNYPDKARCITTDSSGNIYVSGMSSGIDTEWDFATIKYDSNGNELWVSRYNGPGDRQDGGYDIITDTSGNVYVTGESYSGPTSGGGTYLDFATIKYNSSGNELWVARYNGPGNFRDWPRSIEIDTSGNVFVTGDSDGSGTSSDYATIKYDQDGNELWISRYNGPGNVADVPEDMDIDSAGKVYVTGRTGYSRGSSGWTYDYATIKYDSGGSEQWIETYNGPGDSWDFANAVIVDSLNNVFVTGRSIGTDSDDDYATIKYSQETPNQPPVADAGPDQTVCLGNEVVFDGSGSYDPDGTIEYYIWDFGDGNFGLNEVTSHVYTTEGDYTVTLRVEDNEGEIHEDTCIISVIEGFDIYIEDSDVVPSDYQPWIGDNVDISITVHNFDPSEGGGGMGDYWESITPLDIADAGYAQAYEGKIYFIGADGVQRFDPATEDWSVINTIGLGYGSYRGASALIGDRIYIVYGWSDALYYNITFNSFTYIPDPDLHRLDVAVGELNGKLYVSGGWLSGLTTSLKDVERYDPVTNTWEYVAQMQVGRKYHEMISVDEYLYAVCGLTDSGFGNPTRTVEKYDPSSNSWTFVADAASYHREVGISTNGDSILIESLNCESYDIAGDSWSSAPPIPAVGVGFGYFANAACWLNGYAYSIGGRTAPNNWYDDVFRLEYGGSGIDGTCTVSVYLDIISDTNLIDRIYNVEILSNGQVTFDTDWIPTTEGVHEIFVVLSDIDPTDTNPSNNQAQVTVEVLISSEPPLANAGSDQTKNEGDSVWFNGTASHDPDGSIVHYQWDFDEGNGLWWDTGAPPDETGPTPYHIYGDNGIFVATLRVIDNDNLSATDTCNITVLNVEPTLEINSATMDVEIGLRVAGRKFNDVGMTLSENENIVGYISIERMPGSPDDQMAWIPMTLDMTKTYSAVITYTPEDPPNIGGNPTWIYIKFPNGSIQKIHHTFNIQQSKKRDSDHWNHVEPWEVDLNAHLVGWAFEVDYHITDPGSDDEMLTFTYGSQNVIVEYLNGPPLPDPFPSPEVNPRDIHETTTLIYEGPGTLVLQVEDDDGAEVSTVINLA